MDDERILFSIASLDDDESLHVTCDIKGERDMMAFAYVIADYIRKNSSFASMLDFILEIRRDNPELAKKMDALTIEVPDFNELLNNGKR